MIALAGIGVMRMSLAPYTPSRGHRQRHAAVRALAGTADSSRPEGSVVQASADGGKRVRAPARDVLPLDAALAGDLLQARRCALDPMRRGSARRELRHLA